MFTRVKEQIKAFKDKYGQCYFWSLSGLPVYRIYNGEEIEDYECTFITSTFNDKILKLVLLFRYATSYKDGQKILIDLNKEMRKTRYKVLMWIK